MNRLASAIEGDNDGETNRNLGCCDGDHEEHQHLPVIVRQAVRSHVEARESHQGKVGCGEHQLQAHENYDDVPAENHARQADGKQQAGDEEVVVKAGHKFQISGINSE